MSPVGAEISGIRSCLTARCADEQECVSGMEASGICCDTLGTTGRVLDKSIADATGGSVVQWLEMKSNARRRLLDAEWRDWTSLPQDSPARQAWINFWPQSGNVPNWDAVGWLALGDAIDLLLWKPRAT